MQSQDIPAIRRLTAAALCLLGLAAPASAQIYAWRDEQGILNVSDQPRPGDSDGRGVSIRTYAVPEAESVRSTVYTPSEQALSYDDLIVENARRHNVRPDLVRAVVQVESAYNPNARSPKGAQGLMQLMPATARDLGVINPYNPAENIRGGVMYLRQLLDRYDNDEQLALAAYNAGPGAVDKYGESVPPYRETQNYVSKIGKLAGARRLPGTQIYQVTEVASDGGTVVRYTDQKPN